MRIGIWHVRCLYRAGLLKTFIMYHRERGWEVMDWMNLAVDRDQWSVLVNMAINLQVQ
jgi:hypothetical protein